MLVASPSTVQLVPTLQRRQSKVSAPVEGLNGADVLAPSLALVDAACEAVSATPGSCR